MAGMADEDVKELLLGEHVLEDREGRAGGREEGEDRRVVLSADGGELNFPDRV